MIPADPELPAPPVDRPSRTPGRPRRVRRLPVLPVALALVAILAGGALFMSGYSLGAKASSQPGTPAGEDQAFQSFWDAYHSINQRYAGGEVDRNVLVEGAIKGMIESLGDPYSTYLTSDEYKATLQGINGQFEGIGAEIASQATDGTQGCATLGPDCHLLVVAPIDGSPAAVAGVKAGDLVLATDGVSLDGLTVDAARDKVRGPKGTVVTLTIQRGTAAPFDLKITRDVIQQKEVDSKVLADGTVGYVRMTGFSDTAATGVRDALKAHVDAGRTKLILDLRGNPGGFVTAARSVASDFMADGVVFWEQDANGKQEATTVQAGGVATDPEADDRVPHRRRQRVGQRDRRWRPPGQQAGHAHRPAVVRQGHRPAVAGARRRQRVQADDRALADAGQALDPQGGPHPGRRRHDPDGDPGGRGRDARQGDRGAGRVRHDRLAGGRLKGRQRRPLRPAFRFGYGSRERKEVMCSDRQYA